MNLSNLIFKISSGVAAISFYKDSEKIGSGSAFLCKNKIISNNHVFHPEGRNFPLDVNVKIKIADSEFSFQYNKLSDYIIVGSDTSSSDYIVLDIKNEVFFKDKFQFDLGTHEDVKIGDKILVEGYPFEHENLTSHIGYVSAKYINSSINIIQLDASVNNGNSGGPLIETESLKVVGIITRKATGLVRQFDELIDSFDGNIQIFQKLKGTLRWGDLDLMDMFTISQRQMQEIAKNIKRSANVGIGYAFSCDKLKQEDFYLKE